MINPSGVRGKVSKICLQIVADGSKTNPSWWALTPAAVGALQTCTGIRGFPQSIQEASDLAGVKPPLLAEEQLEE